jgi:hypothetical protein
MLALIRPDAWDFPLFLHVLGAVLLFGGTAAIVLLSWGGRRNPAHEVLSRRLAFVTLLAVVWPSFIVMRAAAQWIYDKEKLDPSFPTWVAIGTTVGDGGVVVLLLLTLLGWLSLRRRPTLAPWFGRLALVYLVGLGVAWWAMSAKPGA